MNNHEHITRPLAEDGVELSFRPDLGADMYVHPVTRSIYLDTGNGTFERTARRVDATPIDPAAEFPTDRPRGRPKYGVDLSAEGYA